MAPAATPVDGLEVRSYRTVFDLERRVYRIDRLRLNPGGIPVRGMLYFVALVLATAVAARLPLIGALIRVLPWYARDLAAPAAVATLLTLIRVDGRPFHVVLRALVRQRLRPGQVCRLGCGQIPRSRWHPPALLFLPDGSDHRVRRLSYRGPGAVLITVAHERIEWSPGAVARTLRRPDLTVRELGDQRALRKSQVIELEAGCRLTSAPAQVTVGERAQDTRPQPAPPREGRR